MYIHILYTWYTHMYMWICITDEPLNIQVLSGSYPHMTETRGA